jgi:hypothetical protein
MNPPPSNTGARARRPCVSWVVADVEWLSGPTAGDTARALNAHATSRSRRVTRGQVGRRRFYMEVTHE